MRLAALVEHPDHVCCRYRLRAYEPILRAAGCTFDYLSLDKGWSLHPSFWQALHRADAVVLQRQFLLGWQRALLRQTARRLIFDLDDAVFLRDSYSPRGLQSARRWRQFGAIAHKADVVVAGNSFLQAKSLEAGAHQTTVIPTCVDADRYQIAEHARQDAGVQMVWVGSSSTLQGLTRIGPLLESIGQRWLGLSLKLICDRFFHLRNLPVIPCSWKGATETREIAAADIGISWIPDDDWSRGKCGLKILQYMAAGLPVVANPVGVHRDLVIHGETGFLAESPSDWIEAVGRLMHDRELRRRLGRAGRRRLETHFSVRAGAARWLELLGGFRVGKQAA
ncbi:MAG TPA: glycosyltransferase [Gemmataceae bacterium]|nr:glycosyltransferase [Gemmataceae bacterium]